MSPLYFKSEFRIPKSEISMSALPPPPVISARPKRRYLWLWGLVAVPPLLLLCLALGIANGFRQTSDLRALRRDMESRAGVNWQRQISVHAGALTLDAMRLALRPVRMDAKARTGLEAVRGADVGVYHLSAGAAAPDRVALLSAADECMAGRGWDRVVAVLDKQAMVAVYMPRKMCSSQKLSCCVVVQHQCQLVLVSARVNPEALVELALSQPCFRNGSGVSGL